jgi:hypothetical protein
MQDNNDGMDKKIEKIYHIIEFEIDNANNQISLSKKENINFILLLFALIGFFAFIPADTFFYQWIANGIWMTIVLMGSVGIFSVFIYYYFSKGKLNNVNPLSVEDSEKCGQCESFDICKNSDDPKWEEKKKKFANSMLIDTIGLFYSAFFYTSFFFFLSGMIPYFYFTSSKDIVPTFQSNSWILLLLMLILLIYALLYYRHSAILKQGNFKRYIAETAIFSNIIFIFSAIIAVYGFLSKIPPFTDVPQSSPMLIEHLKIIPSIPLSWIVSLYTLVIGFVVLEYYFSTQYIGNTNRKLEELFILKYRIDRYHLGISPVPNIENILKSLSKQKIYPPSYITAAGILSIPFPQPISRCEEMLYLALEDQPVIFTERSEK